MKKLLKILISLLFLGVMVIVVGLVSFKINIMAPSKESEEVEFTITENSTFYTIKEGLYNNGLIKSKFWYQVYVKLTNPEGLQVGSYILNKNMDLEKLIKTLEGGSNNVSNVYKITFKEGLNIRKISKVISDNTSYSYYEVLNKMTDKNYIRTLIDKYWFLEKDILDANIYYPLEGYLFPETYEFYVTASIEDIIETMLNQTDKILTKYKSNIEKSKYSVHQILTLSSIVEQEASSSNDRAGVAGVFYNRIKGGWALGSDVTTYYALKIDDFSHSLTKSEVNNCSTKYNTRCATFKGLPVGPIDNPGEESIKAAVLPTKHNYYYFVADCTGKTFFNQTSYGHTQTIAKLKASNNWCV